MSSQNVIILGFVIFIVLNIIDFFLTKKILEHGGKEFNPVMNFIYKKFNMFGIFFLKLIVISFLFFQICKQQIDIFTIFYLNLVYIIAEIYMVLDIKKSEILKKL